MEITREWLTEFRTERGGYTHLQHEAIGSNRLSGWVKRAIGNKISEENRLLFESRLSRNTRSNKVSDLREEYHKLFIDLYNLCISTIDDGIDSRLALQKLKRISIEELRLYGVKNKIKKDVIDSGIPEKITIEMASKELFRKGKYTGKTISQVYNIKSDYIIRNVKRKRTTPRMKAMINKFLTHYRLNV